MDRFNPHKVIGVFYLLAGVFAYAVGQSLGNITILATLVLIAGMCVNGAQSAMPSLAARFYPTQGRATGVSWMLGIGRFGAILGAWMGATLLGLGWNFGFVGATALVTDSYRPAERAKVQALNDFLVFGTVALASFGAGSLLSSAGWLRINVVMLPLLGLTLVLLGWSAWRERA